MPGQRKHHFEMGLLVEILIYHWSVVIRRCSRGVCNGTINVNMLKNGQETDSFYCLRFALGLMYPIHE